MLGMMEFPLGDIFLSTFDRGIMRSVNPNAKNEILKTMEDEQASEESEELLDDESKYQESIIEETKGCTELV